MERYYFKWLICLILLLMIPVLTACTMYDDVQDLKQPKYEVGEHKGAKFCGTCHQEIYAQWFKNSRHAVATTAKSFLEFKDQFTDKSERFFVSEIIREKIILFYKQEIPYSVEIEIESFKDEEKIIRITANIYVIRDSQKGIMIGHKGSSLKQIGTEARMDIENFFGKKVFLELFVKVKKDWKDNERYLKQWGY